MLSIDHLNPTNINTRIKSDFLVYPNPFNSEIFLDLNDKISTPAKLKIINKANQIVFEKAILNSQDAIDLNHLSNGIYIMILENHSGIQTKKLIKTK